VKIIDLLTALDAGKILGACLDVLEYEKFNFENITSEELPKEWNALIKRENVLLSPHVAGWTKESYLKLSSYLAEKILNDWC